MKPPKKTMIKTIKRALKLVRYPFAMRLAPEAEKALRQRQNETQLLHAYSWARFVLNWDYSKIQGDSILGDYDELISRVLWATRKEA